MRIRLLSLLFTLPLIVAVASRLAGAQDTGERTVVIGEAGDAVGTGRRWAVVVGVSDYEEEGIPDLGFAHRDAQAFADFLVAQAGFARERVFVFQDDAAVSYPIISQLSHVRREVQPDDVVLFYFAGHGDAESDMGVTFLLTHNASAESYSAFALSSSVLRDELRGMVNRGAHVILITDACRSGGLAGGTEGIAWTHQALERMGEEVGDASFLLSSRGSQVSVEGDWGGGHGVFTYYLLEGLRGAAHDAHNRVTFYDLAGFVQDAVAEATGRRQVPLVDLADAHLDLALVAYEAEQLAALPGADGGTASAGRGDGAAEDGPFWEALRAGRLLAPPDASAWALLAAARAGADAAAVEAMRDALVTALLLDADRVVMRYLRGGNDQPGAAFFRHAADQVAHALALMAPDDGGRRWIEAKRHFLLARAIYREGDRSRYDEALAELDSALALDPDAAYPYHTLGNLYADLRRYDEAEVAYREALRRSPTWEYPQVSLSYIYYQQNRYADVITESERAIRTDPLTYVGFNNLGAAYQDLGRLAEAEAYYRRAVEVAPERGFAHAGLASLYLAAGRRDDALAEAERGVALERAFAAGDPARQPDVKPWRDLAAVLAARGDTEGAARVLEEAVQLAPYRADAHVRLGLLFFEQGQHAEAEAAFRRAIALDPGNPWPYSELAYLLWDQGRAAESNAAILAPTQQEEMGDDPLSFNNLGWYAVQWAEREGEDRAAWHDRAEEAYRRALELDSNYVWALFNLEHLERVRRDLDAAEAWLTRAAARWDTLSPLPHLRLGRLYSDRAAAESDPERRDAWLTRAEAAYRAARRVDGRNATALRGTVRVLVEREDFAGALAALDAAGDLDRFFEAQPGDHARLHLLRAVALDALGRAGEADAAFAASVSAAGGLALDDLTAGFAPQTVERARRLAERR
jgi:tetratricopeptide (TPR) repeat protein